MSDAASNSADLTIEAGQVTLAGTLLSPAQASTLVIFVAGSGPLDRDENAGRQKLNIFNELADALAANGIASFRYDKRGVGKSSGHFMGAGVRDLVQDLKAVITYCRSTGQWDRIVLAGHSEGTILSAMASLETDVDGLILICPFLEPMEEILRAQSRAVAQTLADAKGFGARVGRATIGLLGGVEKMQDRLIAKIKNSRQDKIRFLLKRIPAKWFREHFDTDYAQIYTQIEVPTHLIVAAFDVQCAPQDGAKIAKLIGAQARVTQIENLTHLLRKEAQNGGYATYAKQMKEPVDQELVRVFVEACG